MFILKVIDSQNITVVLKRKGGRERGMFKR